MESSGIQVHTNISKGKITVGGNWPAFIYIPGLSIIWLMSMDKWVWYSEKIAISLNLLMEPFIFLTFFKNVLPEFGAFASPKQRLIFLIIL